MDLFGAANELFFQVQLNPSASVFSATIMSSSEAEQGRPLCQTEDSSWHTFRMLSPARLKNYKKKTPLGYLASEENPQPEPPPRLYY